MLKKQCVALCLTLYLSAGTTGAHDFWIEPSTFTPKTGTAVDVRLREGVDFKGNTLPYIPEWFSDFSQVTANGRKPVESIPGDDPAAVVTARDGSLLLGYMSNRAFVELPAEKFNGYLEEEGMEFVREMRIARGEDSQPAPEYFIRCAKTLIQTGNPTENVYATELGYRLELTPLSNPYLAKTGDKINFKLVYRGKPAPGVLVQAFTSDAPTQRQRIRTDSEGVATITLDRPGVWMIKAVNIQPIIADPKAKWQSYWASFLFELRDR